MIMSGTSVFNSVPLNSVQSFTGRHSVEPRCCDHLNVTQQVKELYLTHLRLLMRSKLLPCRSQRYDGRGRGGRTFDDGASYYSGSRGPLYNDSNFVFVDPHVLGKA